MAWHDCTDGQLLRSARCDPDAFGELYLRHEAIVAGYLQRRTRDAELTADLTAETFAVALLRAGRFRDDAGDGAPAIGWLLGIARHALLRTWERGRTEDRARRRLGIESVAFGDASLERVEALADASDPDNPLLRALRALPPDQMAAIEARVLEERSYADVARDLGVTQATVRQRVSRGLARLRTTIEPEEPR